MHRFLFFTLAIINLGVFRPAAFSTNVGFRSDTLAILEPKDEHQVETQTIVSLIYQAHYRKLPFNDSLSNVVFENYFQALDPNKSYFLKSDLDYFDKYKDQLDNTIPAGDVSFAYQVFSIYRERALNRIDKVYELLKVEPDFSKEETFETDRDKLEWKNSWDELDERWLKIIKNQAMSYKINGKEWSDIAETLEKRFKRLEKAIYQYNSEDVYELYMNAFTSAYDPHTDYFSPVDKENFQIDMSLSLEGIGAQLTQQLDYTKIAAIIPGGPAYKSKLLQKGDRIVGVAQGDDAEFIDVIGWRLDEVVKKIRGPKGTVVRLQVIKSEDDINSLPDTVRLVRDKIKLERSAAKAEIIEIQEGRKSYSMGVVTVPSFYIDFEALHKGDKDYRSTTRDVKHLVDSVKNIGIDGLMIDLRYNGGGSLKEAIELTGLFIPDGPVVIQRNYDNSKEVMKDMDKGEVFYDGPLAVLTNRFSASASEIFSGAIQDYKRGIIVGENTFGKGTVQNLVDLRRHVASRLLRSGQVDLGTKIGSEDIPIGQLKLTLAKFYRVTGSSTQRMGVAPDITFPSPYDDENYGEASRPNALPWDVIATSKFEPTNQISDKMIEHLEELYRTHLAEDEQLQELVKEIEKAKKLRADTEVSLNLEERRAMAKEDEVEDDLATSIDSGEISESESDSEDDKLKDDPYLKEGLRLLAELSRTKVG